MRVVRILNSGLKSIIKLTSRPKPQTEAAPSFVELRGSVDQTIALLAEAGSRLKRLQLDLEDYAAQNWEREKESEEKYYRMTISLFLLLDHLENLAKDQKKSDEIDWLHKKIRRILEDEEIEEITVEKGDHFSGIYHKHVGDRPDEVEKGTVLEVTRKGYYIRGQAQEDSVILRPAEVIVSSGPSGKQPESKIAKKEVEE